jgi:PAS domain S-box-containing protein
MTWPLSRGATFLFVLVILLMTVDGTVFLHNLNMVRDDTAWVAHTHQVLAELEAVLSTVKDAQVGVRGYVITGDKEFLEPYLRSRAELPERFAVLRALVADNPDQLKACARLQAAADDQLHHWQATEEARRDEGFAVAQSLIASGDGKRAMDEMRAIVGAMGDNERALLVERQSRMAAGVKQAVAAVLLATATGTIMALALLTLVAREAKDRLAAQSLANQQRENLRVTLESIGDAVIAADAFGVVTFLNPAAETITGWTAADAIGRPLAEVFRVVHETTRREVESPDAQALRDGTVVGLANHSLLLAKDGREVAIDDSAATVRDASGHATGVVLAFRDISVRRRLEILEREQRDAMVTAERRKDEFLALLAHELRNPIAPIANALQLMALRPLGPAELDELREIMTRQVQQLQRLVDDLLEIARITSGRFALHPATIDLGAVVRAAVDTSRPLIEAAGHTLSVDVPGAPIRLEADYVRLAQVVANLLNNAAKYTRPGGCIKLTVESHDNEVCIRVRDSGVGIAREHLQHLFEGFSPAEPALTRTQGGLGLGLALARNIVEMHGGSIEAHSDGLGKGSEFVVRLSKSASANPAAENGGSPHAALAHLPKRKILVVDDTRASALVLSRLLTALGQDVRTAHDGAAALDAVEHEAFDIIISDIAMPGMSGYELAMRLSAHPQAKKSLLIALTGYGQSKDAERAQRAGFAAHLVKPVGLDDLQAIVERGVPAPIHA